MQQTTMTESLAPATAARCFCGDPIRSGNPNCAFHTVITHQLTPPVMQAAADLCLLQPPVFAKHAAAIRADRVDPSSTDPIADDEAMRTNRLVLAIAERMLAGVWPDTLPPNPIQVRVERLLTDLDELGVTVDIDGNDLDLSGPIDQLDDDLVARLRRDKQAIYVALTGCLPLPDAEVRKLAERHSVEQIEATRSRLRDVAADPDATIWHHQALRDWTAVLHAKARPAYVEVA